MHCGKLGLVLIICYDLGELFEEFRLQAIGILVVIKLLFEPINLNNDISPGLLKRVLDHGTSLNFLLELIILFCFFIELLLQG